ncbi:hypothetical protein ACFU99_20340 [Streptomyces sp. NPDC057654]|uniref:hypothetical protein n=1 Tax=Streptomyces sp. NPDC057654 TaxID=3346196 RepID=UPI0036C4B2EE
MERAPQPRAANLRMVALASAVALAIVLPLAAAVAGPAGRPDAGVAERTGDRSGERTGGGARESASARPSKGPADSRHGAEAVGERPAADGGGGVLSGLGLAERPQEARNTARCGPELSSPGRTEARARNRAEPRAETRVEAQTCVLAQGRDTWSRLYYRNVTGGPLKAVLTLMQPDGRTLQARCEMAGAVGRGSCQTPRERTVRGDGRHGGYTAVSEIASADGRLLLRSGSNSAEGAED